MQPVSPKEAVEVPQAGGEPVKAAGKATGKVQAASNAGVTPPPGAPSLQRHSIRQDLLSTLLTAIFQGEIEPGRSLNIQRFALRFGVSATPVREALVQLSTIGMVEMRHNYGTVARRFGPEELREIYHLRALLESEATRNACGRIPVDALRALQSEMQGLLRERGEHWSEQAMAADRRLHALISSHCGSRRLEEEIGRYNLLMQCIREVVGNDCHAQDKGLCEHLNITEALLGNHPELAAQAMRAHVLSTAESVRQARFGMSMSPSPESPGE